MNKIPNLFNKIRTYIIYNTVLGKFYLNILFWLENKKMEKDLKNRTYSSHTLSIVKESNKIKYENGVNNIKRNIKKEAESLNNEDLEYVLYKNRDKLIELAQSEEEKDKEEYIKNIRKVYVFKDKDIKNEKDYIKMINKRITHFNELRKNKEKRELSRKIRLSTKNNDKIETEKLLKEWNNLYGKKTRS